MRSVGKFLPVIASIVLILMTIGCGVRAGSGPALEQSLVTEPAGGSSGGSDVAPEIGRTLGLPVVPIDPVIEPVIDPAEESSQPGEIPSGAATNRGFGAAHEIDDPFAVIGLAFSGLGFQSYSSGCDPFEDTYGTCL